MLAGLKGPLCYNWLYHLVNAQFLELWNSSSCYLQEIVFHLTFISDPVCTCSWVINAWERQNVNKMSQLMTKPTKLHVCPAKTQISLGIRPVWSKSSLSAWRSLGSLAIHWAHSKDSDQTGRMPRLIWVFAGRTCHFICFVMKWLIYVLRLLIQCTQKRLQTSALWAEPETGRFCLTGLIVFTCHKIDWCLLLWHLKCPGVILHVKYNALI